MNVGLRARLVGILVKNLRQIQVLFGGSLIDDLERLPFVWVLRGRSIDHRTVRLECFCSEMHRRDKGGMKDDAGGCIALAGTTRDGGGKEGTYRSEWIRSG